MNLLYLYKVEMSAIILICPENLENGVSKLLPNQNHPFGEISRISYLFGFFLGIKHSTLLACKALCVIPQVIATCKNNIATENLSYVDETITFRKQHVIRAVERSI